MVYRIVWSQTSRNDLKNIYEFIAKDSARHAQNQVKSIQDSVSNLAEFPLMGRNLPEFPLLPYREIVTGNYRVLYNFNEDQELITVMSVVHTRRSFNENI